MTRTRIDDTKSPADLRNDTGVAGDADADSSGEPDVPGENVAVERDADLYSGVDIAAHRIVGAEEAGLGHGLDQAEEAQLGTTDEEIEAALIERTGLKQD